MENVFLNSFSGLASLWRRRFFVRFIVLGGGKTQMQQMSIDTYTKSQLAVTHSPGSC